MDAHIWSMVNNYIDLFETPSPAAAASAAELWAELVALVGLPTAQAYAAEAHRSRYMARRLLGFVHEDR